MLLVIPSNKVTLSTYTYNWYVLLQFLLSLLDFADGYSKVQPETVAVFDGSEYEMFPTEKLLQNNFKI